MFGTLPRAIDPYFYAAQQRDLQGRLELAGLPRLVAATRRVVGAAELTATCRHHADGLCKLQGRLQAQLHLSCQRCLGEIVLAIDSELDLALVTTEAEAAAWQQTHDVLLLNENGLNGLDIQALIEDELLLHIPLAPMHTDPAACDPEMLAYLQAEPLPEKPARENPFAILARLKRNE